MYPHLPHGQGLVPYRELVDVPEELVAVPLPLGPGDVVVLPEGHRVAVLVLLVKTIKKLKKLKKLQQNTVAELPEMNGSLNLAVSNVCFI